MVRHRSATANSGATADLPKSGSTRWQVVGGCPVTSIIVHVPPDIDRYTCADKDMLTLKHAAYWVSLRDEDKIPGRAAHGKSQ